MSSFADRDAEYNNGTRYWCTDCNKACDVVVVDDGIGPYEYQGMRGFDSVFIAVSDCCEAQATDVNGEQVSANDVSDGEPCSF